MDQRAEFCFLVPTLALLKGVDLAPFDSAYLGNPFCLKTADNLLSNAGSLAAAVEYLKTRGKKAYLATPVVPLPGQFTQIKRVLKTAVSAGIDAVEVHDMGVFLLCRETYPELRVHLGVFANVYNRSAARKFGELGAVRLIPSQELTLREIDDLAAGSRLEIELPVQGKAPLGVTNACLLSMELPSRRPLQCRQQCAEEHWLQFNGWKMRTVGTATFTACDLAMIEHLPLLIKKGYRIFRFSTLFDSPPVISRVGRVYRQAVEEIERGSFFGREALLDELKEITGGELCNGWFFGHSGREYLGWREGEVLWSN